MIKNKKTFGAVCMLLCAAFTASLSACAVSEAAAGASTSAATSSSLAPDASVVSSGADPNIRFALENLDYRKAELENFKNIGAQIFSSDSRAYEIAAAIYQYRDYHNSLIFNEAFSGLASISPAMLVEIAVSQTPHIDIYHDDFQDAPDSHPIKAFSLAERAAGRAASLLTYGDDARAKARKLFGQECELPRGNGLTIRYNKDLDLYYLPADSAAMTTDYPILTSLKENGAGAFTARAVTVCYWDYPPAWSSVDGKWESSETADVSELRNYLIQNRNLKQNTYELTRGTDGILRVTGYAQG